MRGRTGPLARLSSTRLQQAQSVYLQVPTSLHCFTLPTHRFRPFVARFGRQSRVLCVDLTVDCCCFCSCCYFCVGSDDSDACCCGVVLIVVVLVVADFEEVWLLYTTQLCGTTVWLYGH